MRKWELKQLDLAKKIVFLVVCYVCLTVLFMGLTLLHGRISSALTARNMNKSLATLDKEGNYCNFLKIFGLGNLAELAGHGDKDKEQRGVPLFAGSGDQIDNFTNMWMIQSLDSEHFFDHEQYGKGLPYNAENRLPIEGGKNVQVFRSGWEDGNYWSGYRLFFQTAHDFS